MEKETYEISVENIFNKEFRKKLINKEFKEARKFVEKKLGIELTLIELVELRKNLEFTENMYVNDIIKFVKGIGGDKYSIHPGFEAALIFMNKNYGTQIYNLEDKSNFNIQRYEAEKLLGFDYYPEYFKRVQEEMHFP
jgi:hypothetical protein